MNPETFFENLDLLCEAPNGIEKLRELILQLAVMGKLVPQDPNDEPASVLLEKIKTEKKKTGQDGKTKESKLLSSKDVDQIPYEIPSNWEWTTLSECGLINPRNDISDEKEVSFIPMTCISEKYGQSVEMEIRKWEEIKKGFTHFAENDIVLAKITLFSKWEIRCYERIKEWIWGWNYRITRVDL